LADEKQREIARPAGRLRRICSFGPRNAAICDHLDMLHHVAIPVPSGNLDACEAFYTALGFASVEPPEGLRGRARWLQHGGTQIHLLIEEDAGPLPGGAHLAVVASDYEDALERLTALGADVEPRRQHWGSPRAYVHDPAGHLVEVMAWPPA
jgi:catechol 2,3-dioxygenase-like lactoylglutathione lyase family enzyme